MRALTSRERDRVDDSQLRLDPQHRDGIFVYHPFAQVGAGLVPSIFFAFVPLVWGVMFSTAWLLGADLLEGRSRDILARAYSRVGAASIAGAVGGGALARLVSNICPPEDLLLFGAAWSES